MTATRGRLTSSPLRVQRSSPTVVAHRVPARPIGGNKGHFMTLSTLRRFGTRRSASLSPWGEWFSLDGRGAAGTTVPAPSPPSANDRTPRPPGEPTEREPTANRGEPMTPDHQNNTPRRRPDRYKCHACRQSFEHDRHPSHVLSVFDAAEFDNRRDVEACSSPSLPLCSAALLLAAVARTAAPTRDPRPATLRRTATRPARAPCRSIERTPG